MNKYFVYIIGEKQTGPLKIGVTTNLENRLASMQTSSPVRLSVLKHWVIEPNDAYRIEAILHCELDCHRLNGEWFNCSLTKASKQMQKIIFIIKESGIDFYKKAKAPVRSLTAQKAGLASAAKAKAKSAAGIAKIKDKWPLPSSQHSTDDLLAEAGVSLNTIKKHLGSRPIAQYNYQAKLKRKANAKN